VNSAVKICLKVLSVAPIEVSWGKYFVTKNIPGQISQGIRTRFNRLIKKTRSDSVLSSNSEPLSIKNSGTQVLAIINKIKLMMEKGNKRGKE
jgi:hypothetical protein